jgi:hypothetical protein
MNNWQLAPRIANAVTLAGGIRPKIIGLTFQCRHLRPEQTPMVDFQVMRFDLARSWRVVRMEAKI